MLDYEECLKKFDVDIHGVRILFQCARTSSSLSLAGFIQIVSAHTYL